MNFRKAILLLILSWVALCAAAANAENQILGEVEINAANKAAKSSGVWVDGQYVGYVKELKGDRKLLLLPGEHLIVVRQSGFADFKEKVVAEPGRKKTLEVKMDKDPGRTLPQITSQIKLEVNPDRAAVFLDNAYVGHVSEFSGVGRAMLLPPGTHRIKIELPGYQSFETEIALRASQKYTVKTNLEKGSITQAGALIKQD